MVARKARSVWGTRFNGLLGSCLVAAAILLVAGAFEWALALTGAFVGLTTLGILQLPWGLMCEVTCRSEVEGAQVALTYDDGPDPASTPALLELLKSRGVRATFFCVGECVRTHPDLVRRIHAEGHCLGGHSDRHGAWTMFYRLPRLRREILAGQEAIEAVIGERVRFFRPPYGHSTHRTDLVAKESSLEVIAWDVRGYDSFGRSSESVARSILGDVRHGSIVLMHDGGRSPEKVVQATTLVLDGLEQRGLSAARLDELLG